jgi:hypothetical protein
MAWMCFTPGIYAMNRHDSLPRAAVRAFPQKGLSVVVFVSNKETRKITHKESTFAERSDDVSWQLRMDRSSTGTPI